PPFPAPSASLASRALPLQAERAPGSLSGDAAGTPPEAAADRSFGTPLDPDAAYKAFLSPVSEREYLSDSLPIDSQQESSESIESPPESGNLSRFSRTAEANELGGLSMLAALDPAEDLDPQNLA